MSRKINVFVSYTVRDGKVTIGLLKRIQTYLSKRSDPFVDALATSVKHPQLRIVWKLLRSDLVILIESPGIKSSPWVRLEVLLARLLLTPIIRLRSEHILSSIFDSTLLTSTKIS